MPASRTERAGAAGKSSERVASSACARRRYGPSTAGPDRRPRRRLRFHAPDDAPGRRQVAVAYGFVVADDIEIRTVRASEYAAAGEATASAFRDTSSPERTGAGGIPGADRRHRKPRRPGRRRVGGSRRRASSPGSEPSSSNRASAPARRAARARRGARPHARRQPGAPRTWDRPPSVLACIEMARDQGKRRLTLGHRPGHDGRPAALQQHRVQSAASAGRGRRVLRCWATRSTSTPKPGAAR